MRLLVLYLSYMRLLVLYLSYMFHEIASVVFKLYVSWHYVCTEYYAQCTMHMISYIIICYILIVISLYVSWDC